MKPHLHERSKAIPLPVFLGTFLITALFTAQLAAQDHEVRQVSFPSGNITIAADLNIPTGAGPFPVVIWVHGSGKSPRSNPVAQAYASEFVERGFAFLNPDKRGSGESEGDWTNATFEELAQDVNAAVAFVQQAPEIDKNRIAILGFSQGSHIVAFAGSQPSISRVISLSGSVVPLKEQIRDEVRMMGVAENLTSRQLYLLDSLNLLAFAYAGTLRDEKSTIAEEQDVWSRYEAFRKELLATPLSSTESLMGFPEVAASPKFRFLARVGDFNPLVHWKAVKVPVLFVFGSLDENVDVVKSVSLIERNLIGPDKHVTVIEFGMHGHAFVREDQLDFITRWIVEDE